MRVTTDIIVHGKTLDSILEQASEQWKIISDDPIAELPDNAEVTITRSSTIAHEAGATTTTTGRITIRTKVDLNGTGEER